MSLFIASLNSGSNGNSYFIGNGKESVLIDVGISCREVEKRMARLELSLNTVKAIFISHEHSDHIRGVSVLSKKYRLPVYITQKTLKSSGIGLEKKLVKPFKADKPVAIGELLITAFSKHHDASDPHSFIVEGNAVKIGIFTDIGAPCGQLIRYFRQCHAAFLESNYDEVMLEQGSYPVYLKNRIRSDKGHLSNTQALELFTLHGRANMSHLILSHLSKNNNCPELVHDLFTEHAMKTRIVVASRYKETEVIYVGNKKRIQAAKKKYVTQLSLFPG